MVSLPIQLRARPTAKPHDFPRLGLIVVCACPYEVGLVAVEIYGCNFCCR